ncbi:Glutamyl-tRNA(Gln) amidotransferase subunit A [Achromobacter spanius]|uniref:amidase n=1 Tax=Achromobacter spanius TaxID=217203 RepID=UPI000C2BBB75|nr:amidase [Achromobacter spanius]AUA58032.1 amidase [Achromobacter spanius]CAB3625190.1 2-amino-5-chloromuconic acid deaminase [Achromobacter spanius]SPT42139.1 Glutamyl-tRNA(Gln) amidotransferase subunit A [Achromobacter denitrificans]VEE59902.1 Glutamyl-tRNA(Gln) amidotransferase subunit A [Achromobacter spanius]
MVSTLNELTLALGEGRTTSVALTELALARAQDAAGEGARVFTKLYAESALAQARASDTLRAAGIVRSAVEGLPISIKDLFDIEGETTMAGSVAREGEPAADANAEVVQRLIAAGAVIIGRTNMTEFAYSGLGINPHYGTPLNPYDRGTGRIPGGSSSGAAVSVADGMAVAGIGSDTGGSVRIPAALCGLTGFKPSAWRVSMTGVLPLSVNLDSIGPIAGSVRCCAELDAILSGDGGPVPEAMALRGLRLAVPTTLALDAMEKHVADSFAAAVAKLKEAGALVEEIAIPEFAELGNINSKGGFTAAEAWAWHRDLIARAGKRYDPRVVSRIMRGQDMSAADYLDLLDAREAWVAAVDHRIAGYDALIMPTTPIVAPAVADLVASDEAYYAANGLILRNPTLINFLDGCALSLPCHAPGMAPVGLMISGSNGADRRILAVGLAVEALLAGR